MISLTSAIIVASALSFSLYILILRLIPIKTLYWIYGMRVGRLVVDLTLFLTTTMFMIVIAGASMFAMTVGAIAGLLCSLIVFFHHRAMCLMPKWFGLGNEEPPPSGKTPPSTPAAEEPRKNPWKP